MTVDVTVAVASYNHAEFVEAALASVAAQDVAVELVWIDDCSTDGSFEVARKALDEPSLRKRFTSATLMRNRRNRGAHYTLNLAARLGRGRLIAFLNSDDVYRPGRIRRLTEAYSGDESWIAFTACEPIDADGRVSFTEPLAYVAAYDAAYLVGSLGSVSTALLAKQIAISTGNLIVTRRLFDTLGGFRPLRYCHDWDFILRSALQTEPVFLRDRLYGYRLHAANSFRDLADVGEHEAQRVLETVFAAVARREPRNPLFPSFRKAPASFWATVSAAGCADAAAKTLFPYPRDTRHLDQRHVTALPQDDGISAG